MSGARDIVHAPSVLALKVATRGLTAGCGGGDAAAATLRERGGSVRQQRMSDCGNPNTPDFLRIDEAAALEDVTVGQPGWPHITRAMAARQNCVVFVLPTLPICADAAHAALGEVLAETADVVKTFGAAWADGQIKAHESAEVSQQIDEAIIALTKAKALVQDAVRA